MKHTSPYAPGDKYVPVADGLRAIFIFIVAWYHIWQQSWWTPHVGTYSLDFLVRAGYVPVDGTILLSGFLLFLPHARVMLLGESVPDVRTFYQKRIMRIVPSYVFVTLLMLFAVAIPYNLYWRPSDLWKDLLMHLTFTQTFDFSTYIATPIGVASWTVAIEMQAYLIFPLLARWARKNPLGTLSSMAALALLFRSFVVWGMKDYNMVVNQLINFLDVYAIGMASALLYVKLTTLWPKRGDLRLLLNAAATIVLLLALYGLVVLLQAQAGTPGSALQAGQMMRRPLFALLLAAVAVAGYTLIGRAVRSDTSTAVYTYLVYTVCALVLVLTCAFQGQDLLGHGSSPIWVGLALAVFSTILGHSIFSWGLKYLSAAFVAVAKLAGEGFAG